MSTDTISDALLAMEPHMRVIANALTRDEFESLLDDALDDVYEDESND